MLDRHTGGPTGLAPNGSGWTNGNLGGQGSAHTVNTNHFHGGGLLPAHPGGLPAQQRPPPPPAPVYPGTDQAMPVTYRPIFNPAVFRHWQDMG